ncbi:FHA domain-containing protein [Myxococcota bacterium]|nr:FHA domain-containing protein [Myxococcota bacterium]
MATLRSTGDGTLHPVSARMLVGRAAACALRVLEPAVSGEHATIGWTGHAWSIRDLGSTNGTFVDGVRLDPGVARTLTVGAKIGFGAPEGWELIDASAPGAIAVDLKTGEMRAAKDGLLALPEEESPILSIYQDHVAGWVCETVDGDTPREVDDQEVVAAAGRKWRLHLPVVLEGTPMVEPGPSIDDVSFRFAVSRNEEHVELTVIHRRTEIHLDPHDHHYVLLTLARVRAAERDLPMAERGWVDRDRLMKMLSMEPNTLNVAIHRARQQLLAAGIERAGGIVEVRSGQRRFGSDRFQIVPL